MLGVTMKIWFPNKAQWIVMWIGLILVFAAWGTDRSGSQVPPQAVFVAIATVFILWMLEGRRRKSSHKDP
jgi:uncharacterized membrane protein YqjE